MAKKKDYMLAKTDNPADAEQPGSTIALWTEGGATDDKAFEGFKRVGLSQIIKPRLMPAGAFIHARIMGSIDSPIKEYKNRLLSLHILTGAGAGVDVCFPITAVLETALSKNPDQHIGKEILIKKIGVQEAQGEKVGAHLRGFLEGRTGGRCAGRGHRQARPGARPKNRS